MRLLSWRTLLLALAVGLATWWTCTSLWPEPKARALLPQPWQTSPVATTWKITALEFSPDDSQIAVAAVRSNWGSPAFWVIQLGSGYPSRRIEPPNSSFKYLQVRPNGIEQAIATHLVPLGPSSSLVPQAVAGLAVGGFLSSDLKEPLQTICFDRDGKVLMAVLDGGDIVVRKVDTGQETARVPWYNLPERGRRALTGWLIQHVPDDKNQDIIFCNARTGASFEKKALIPSGGYGQAQVTADSRYLVHEWYPNIHISEWKSGKKRKLPFSPGWCPASWDPIAIAPDGQTIAVPVRMDYGAYRRNWLRRSLSQAGIETSPPDHYDWCRVQLYDANTGQQLVEFPRADCAAFSHDGKTLALATGEGVVELWDYPIARPPLLVFRLAACAMGVLTIAIASWWKRQRKSA
jgi:hypothetical protein